MTTLACLDRDRLSHDTATHSNPQFRVAEQRAAKVHRALVDSLSEVVFPELFSRFTLITSSIASIQRYHLLVHHRYHQLHCQRSDLWCYRSSGTAHWGI